MPKLTITIGEEADKLLKSFQKSTGLASPDRTVEECIFTIHELLEAVKEHSKTTGEIKADKLAGIVASFQRFPSKYP